MQGENTLNNSVDSAQGGELKTTPEKIGAVTDKKEDSPIEVALREQEMTNNDLSNALEILSSKIIPILSEPVPQDGEAKSEDKDSVSELVRMVNMRTSQVRLSIRVIQDLCERIEL